MKKLLLCAIFILIAARAFATDWQYFIACDKLWAIDANATTEEILYWIDVIESDCDRYVDEEDHGDQDENENP